jgi:hypothetical protein
VASKSAQSASDCSVTPNGVVGYATSGLESGNVIVLGRVSVHPGYFRPTVPVSGPWPYWQKNGIEILAGTPVVSISVPESWRQRAAITWGNNSIVSALRLTACSRPAGVWDGYAGGIYLRSAAACVPLIIRIGDRSVTVRFGIGQHCVK